MVKLKHMTPTETIETSIQKTFRKTIFAKFCRAINEYDLIQPNDKIAVCISGGKDSMLMAKLFQELKRHNKIPFELVFLVMDPGYSPANRTLIENNTQLLNIPATFFTTDIFENVASMEKSPCYICARMRRGHLYHQAQMLGCNKIALGHHYDDVIETILMGMLYGAQIQTMMPKLYSKNFPGMQLIRPMYLVREQDIIRWRDANHLNFIQCACKFTEKTATDEHTSKRQTVKKLIAQLKQNDPQIERNIFRSMENVNLATIITYKDKAGNYHNFQDDYRPKHWFFLIAFINTLCYNHSMKKIFNTIFYAIAAACAGFAIGAFIGHTKYNLMIIIPAIIAGVSLLIAICLTNAILRAKKQAQNANVTLKKKDIILSAGEEYTVGKRNKIRPGEYLILATNESEKTFNVRVNEYVKEFRHNTTLVLAEGDTISARSANVILRQA